MNYFNTKFVCYTQKECSVWHWQVNGDVTGAINIFPELEFYCLKDNTTNTNDKPAVFRHQIVFLFLIYLPYRNKINILS